MEEEKDKSKKEREKNRFSWCNCVSRIKRNWRNWIKGILVFLCIGGCVVVISMACAGWRIVYAPELEPDWDSISAVSSLISAVGTVAAVWSAVQVPQKIANRQDKIALYEKRINAFHAMEELKEFSEYISVPENQNVLKWQTEYWGIHNLFESKEVANLRFSCMERSLLTHKCLEQDIQAINGLCFLFPDVTMGETNIISKELSQFILYIYGESGQELSGDLVKENRQHFVTVFDDFYNRNKKKMIDLLMLTK